MILNSVPCSVHCAAQSARVRLSDKIRRGLVAARLPLCQENKTHCATRNAAQHFPRQN